MPDTPPESAPEQPLSGSNESIILVDDDPNVRAASEDMLTHLGYRVTLCSSGAEVLDRVREAPDGFDLLITDYNMPDMDGQMLANEMQTLKPELPIILCTGYAREIDPATARRLGITDFYVKPIALDTLSRLIRRILDGTRDD